MRSTSYQNFGFTIVLGFLLLAACNSGTEKIQYLTNENTELRENYQKQLIETRSITKTADSLQTIIHSQQREIQKMKGEMPTYKASGEDEKSIAQLVDDLHRGWTAMLNNDDTNEILKYFLKKYTTSSIRINTENIPSVQRSNDASFEEYLNQLMIANDVSLSFGQTKFLYTEVKGDIFATAYQTTLRVYQNNEQMYTSSLITQLAGQKVDGSWKVGSYNWVNFTY